MQRIILLVVTLFFGTMNVLLWRTQIVGDNPIASRVPLDAVWQRMLEAPDLSALEIRHQGEKIGALRWVPAVLEAPHDPQRAESEVVPEGLVKQFTGYQVEADGHVFLEARKKLQFTFNFELHTNQTLRKLHLRVGARSQAWDFAYAATNQALRLRTEGEGAFEERLFPLATRGDWEAILREFAGPVFANALLALGFRELTAPGLQSSVGVSLQARSDRLRLRHSRLRGYRVTLRWLDRLQASVFVNAVGEIIRADLPEGVMLLNDGLMTF